MLAQLYIVGVIFPIVAANRYYKDTDKPCAARQIDGKSVICVCDEKYCDTITRVIPSKGTYVAYTSSESGLRFKKTFGKLLKYRDCGCYDDEDAISGVELDPSELYQEISGFGTAVTDAAGINWLSLKNPRARQNLVNSYYGTSGIEYTMMRLPMGGTDFSTRGYAYNVDEGDYNLTSFDLAPEDYKLKIPLIKECMEAANETVRIVASMWSPPAWMKTTNDLRLGYLKEDCYQTLADYFYKFLESYSNCGVPIWGVTTTNEPLAGTMFGQTIINTLQWIATDLGTWIENNLGPTIRNSTFKNVKIIGGDDQRFTIPLWFNYVILVAPGALKYLDGIAVHFYFDQYTPPSQLTQALQDYPDVFVISTEACEGAGSINNTVDLGSWTRAENYATYILEDLNHRSIGWIDWNMCLNEEGGPNWIGNYVDSPIIVSAKNQEFYKQPMFYAMGHFSKFIPRGSRRMKLTITEGLNVQHVAFLTPQNTIVVVFLNKTNRRTVFVKLVTEYAKVTLEEKSITTVEFPYKNRVG